MLYDSMDSVPTTLADASGLSGFSTGGVRTGHEGSSLLNPRKVYREIPPGAIATRLDVKDSKWWRWISTADLATLGVSTADANIYVPGRLFLATLGGASTTATEAGNVYIVYDIELCDPIPAGLNA